MTALKLENEHEQSEFIDAITRSQIMIEYGPDGKVLNANAKFLKFTGFELSEIVGKPHSLFCAEQEVESFEYKKLWEGLKRGESASGQFKRFAKNNKEVWITASYCPVMNADGVVYKIVTLATDFTEIKAELQVRTDIMNMTSIVSESDLRGDITSINEKYTEISKYTREELIGKPHNITRHPDMPKEVFKEMWGTIGRGKMFRGVVKNRAKDGSPYYVDAVIAPIMGDNGKPKKYLGVRYDITEAESERHNMRAVFGAIDSAIAYVEFDTSGNVLTANSNFLKTVEYQLDEVKGKQHKIFCEAETYNSPEYPQFWKVLSEGQSHSGIFKRKSKSGKSIWMQSVYAPVFDETGRVTKVIKIATDVTDQQNMIYSIQETASALSSASTELTATASEMSSTADKTSQEAKVATAAAEEVSVGVQTVATNIEEMVASIKEIGRSTNESSQMAKMTLLKAQESNMTVTKLGLSSQEVGDVIKVISSIAQQTNLLALNATIEAARAGEAGKGFAVVANEVKELAKQTAKATDDITNKIGAIQSDTRSAIEAIGGISQAVEKLNGISGVIAAAVEEQTATTNEISRVVVQSKRGVESITGNIKLVSLAAGESHTSSTQTLEASRELAQLAEKLTQLTKRTHK
jgi:methyl-accepting chemotaxis protein